jgi:hypothetical protein
MPCEWNEGEFFIAIKDVWYDLKSGMAGWKKKY